MITELDIYRSAAELIRQKGDNALHVAALRASTFQARGNVAGSAMWLRIAEAIRVLQAKKPRPGMKPS